MWIENESYFEGNAIQRYLPNLNDTNKWHTTAVVMTRFQMRTITRGDQRGASAYLLLKEQNFALVAISDRNWLRHKGRDSAQNQIDSGNIIRTQFWRIISLTWWFRLRWHQFLNEVSGVGTVVFELAIFTGEILLNIANDSNRRIPCRILRSRDNVSGRLGRCLNEWKFLITQKKEVIDLFVSTTQMEERVRTQGFCLARESRKSIYIWKADCTVWKDWSASRNQATKRRFNCRCDSNSGHAGRCSWWTLKCHSPLSQF